MIFASDLDGTIIFSNNHFTNKHKKINVVNIEKKDNEEISYMTFNSINILNKISKLVTFIPVTTRTIEQYKRIDFPKYKIVPEIAITSNGGNILINGTLDIIWGNYIKEKIASSLIKANDIFAKFSLISNDLWIKSYRFSDGLFWTFILDKEKIPITKLNDFIVWSNKNEWQVSLQGRKLYL